MPWTCTQPPSTAASPQTSSGREAGGFADDEWDDADASDSRSSGLPPTVVLGGNHTGKCVLSADQASHFCGLEEGEPYCSEVQSGPNNSSSPFSPHSHSQSHVDK